MAYTKSNEYQVDASPYYTIHIIRLQTLQKLDTRYDETTHNTQMRYEEGDTIQHIAQAIL